MFDSVDGRRGALENEICGVEFYRAAALVEYELISHFASEHARARREVEVQVGDFRMHGLR